MIVSLYKQISAFVGIALWVCAFLGPSVVRIQEQCGPEASGTRLIVTVSDELQRLGGLEMLPLGPQIMCWKLLYTCRARSFCVLTTLAMFPNKKTMWEVLKCSIRKHSFNRSRFWIVFSDSKSPAAKQLQSKAAVKHGGAGTCQCFSLEKLKCVCEFMGFLSVYLFLGVFLIRSLWSGVHIFLHLNKLFLNTKRFMKHYEDVDSYKHVTENTGE